LRAFFNAASRLWAGAPLEEITGAPRPAAVHPHGRGERTFCKVMESLQFVNAVSATNSNLSFLKEPNA